MARCIHARKVNGKVVFRIWSTITDSYVTGELSENDVRDVILARAISEAVRQYNEEIDERIALASSSGTSSLLEESHDLNEPWKNEN